MRDGPGAAPALHMAIVGNHCVGKTCLFDRLCDGGKHPVDIPGSTTEVKRGVLATGPGRASRSVKRQCLACRPRKADRDEDASLCFNNGGAGPERTVSDRGCPALQYSANVEKVTPLVTLLYDTPGSTTLAANSDDEMVARDLVLSGQIDGVIVVLDAKNLRRSLAFALEVAETGLPLVLDLNMLDEAEDMGIEVDDAALARELGVPVGRTVATENRGVRGLSELILDAQISKRSTRFPEALDRAIARLSKILGNPVHSSRALGLLVLSGDQHAEAWVADHLGEKTLEEARAVVAEAQGSFHAPLKRLLTDFYYAEAERIMDRAVISSARSPGLLVRFGALAQRPLPGALIGLGVLALAYAWVGVFGATFVVDNLSARLFDGILVPGCNELVRYIPSTFVRDAIMDPDFGILPSGLFLAIGIVLPVLFCFYLLQAVLEDSGYLPRLAVLFNRLFRRIGLNGQGMIPLVLGFSCIAMAVITGRMLSTRRERNIIALLVVGIPCAPLLAVMTVILDRMPWTAWAVIFGLVGLRIAVAGFAASRLLPGRLPDLILEIPKMRIPRPRVLWAKTWRRTWQFMREAVPIFVAASFVVFLADRLGVLELLENVARPLVHDVLGLPDQAMQVFVKTAIRRENGATELEHLRAHFDGVQLVVTMLVMTFVTPCINATIVIIKECGMKACLVILSTTIASAITVGALVNLTCRFLGITFA